MTAVTRWYVVDTRIWEVTAASEAEAIALVEDQPEQPAYRTTVAEQLAPAAGERPHLRVLP